MLKTPYKSIYRVHSVEEALEFDIGKGKTDMLLYFIDIYDVLLSVEANEINPPSLDQVVELRMKCTEYLLQHYHTLYTPIPGVLLGWTTSMLLFVIIMHLIRLQYINGSIYLTQPCKQYIKDNRLRMYQDPDPETWCFATYVSMLDVLSLKWKALTPCDHLDELLEVMWRLCSKFTLNIHSKIVLNVDNYNEDVKTKPDHARLSEQAIIVTMSRFYWFRTACNYYRRWRKGTVSMVPQLSATNWSSFIRSERRHFVTRRFRDSILTFMWDKIILYGDKEVASHSQLGEDVSAMTCLYQRFPAGFLNKLQKLVTYEEYEDIIKFEPTKDWVHLCMINQHFVNTYNVKFLSYFFISEEKTHKHLQAIERSVVPLILYRFGGFDIYFEGKVFAHPEGRSIEYAFVLWTYMLRTRVQSRAFSMDFTPLCEALLDKDEEVDNTRVIEGMVELDDY